MALNDYLTASGIIVHKGKQLAVYEGATGGIWARPGVGNGVGREPKLHRLRALHQGIDRNLWAVLKVAADRAGVEIYLDAVRLGRIAFITQVRPTDRSWWEGTHAASGLTIELVRWLVANGMPVGFGKTGPGLLWGKSGAVHNPTVGNYSTKIRISVGPLPK